MTRILGPDETAALVDGLVYLKTQRAAVGLDLTVGSVHRLTSAGALDFGGSEEEAAALEPVEPERRSEDDDYGWWELPPGSYLVRYNESLDPGPGRWARISPLERLLAAGASHAEFVVDGSRDPLQTLLHVGGAGCGLKENCRISRLVVMEGS